VTIEQDHTGCHGCKARTGCQAVFSTDVCKSRLDVHLLSCACHRDILSAKFGCVDLVYRWLSGLPTLQPNMLRLWARAQTSTGCHCGLQHINQRSNQHHRLLAVHGSNSYSNPSTQNRQTCAACQFAAAPLALSPIDNSSNLRTASHCMAQMATYSLAGPACPSNKSNHSQTYPCAQSYAAAETSAYSDLFNQTSQTPQPSPGQPLWQTPHCGTAELQLS
jgi:hypothetical protein